MKKANQAKKIVPAAVAAGLVMTSGLTAFAATDATEAESPAAEASEPSASQQSEEDDTSGDKTDEETAVEETKIEQAVSVGEPKTDTETGTTTEEKLLNVDINEKTTEATAEGTAEVATTEPTTKESAVTPVEGAEEKIPEAGTTIEKDSEGNEVITEIKNEEKESERDNKPTEGTATETNPITAPSGKEIGQETTETTTTITGEKTETDTTSTTITTPEEPISKTEGGEEGNATEEVEKTLTDESGKKVDQNYNTDETGKVTSDRDWSTVTSGDKFTVSGTEYTVDSNDDVKGEDDKTVGHKITMSREDTYDAKLTSDELCEVLGADKNTWKASETDADTYTYTNADNKTVTVKVTRDDSSVTVKSTIVITETDGTTDETAKKNVDNDTKVEVNTNDDQTIKDAMDLVTYNKATGEYEAKDSKTTVVSLNEVGDFKGSISTIVKKKDNGETLTYTFEYEYTQSDSEAKKASEAAIAALGSDGIAQLLNDTHYTSLDGKLYYTDDNGIQRELNLTEAQDALKQKGVSVKVTLEDSEKYDSADKYLEGDGKTTADSEKDASDSAKADAQEKAAKKALDVAADSLKTTYGETDYSKTDYSYNEETGLWSVTVTVKNSKGITETHTLTAKVDADSTTGSTELEDDSKITIDVSDDEGHDYKSEFSSGIKYTENVNAHVSSEVITWKEGQTPTVNTTEDVGKVKITVDTTGGVTVTDNGTAAAGTTVTVTKVDDNTWTKTVENGNTTITYTYKFTQTELKEGDAEYDKELEQWKNSTDYDAEKGSTDVHLTKVTWSVTTTTVETKKGITTDEASELKKDDEPVTTPTIDTATTTVTQVRKDADGNDVTTETTGDSLDAFDWSSVAEGDTIKLGDTTYTVAKGGNVQGTNAGKTTHTITMTSTKESPQLLTKSDVEKLYGLTDGTLTQAIDEEGKAISDTYTYTENGNEITIKVTHNSGTDVATSTLKLTVTDKAKSETAWNVPIKDTTVDLEKAKTDNTLIAEALSKKDAGWKVEYYTEADGAENAAYIGSIKSISGTNTAGEKTITYTFTYGPAEGSTTGITGEEIENLGNQAIADMLNRAEGSQGGYYVSEDGNTLYDKYDHAITSVEGIQNELAKQNVKVTVTKSDGNNYKDAGEKTISDSDTQTKAAKKQAADDALAAAKASIEKDTGSATITEQNYDEKTGTLTAKITDKDGKEHSIIINATSNTPTSDSSATAAWNEVATQIDGIFHSGTKYTVTADANVSKETITWTETGKDAGTTVSQTLTSGAKLSIDKDGNIKLYDGETEIKANADGTYTYTATGTDGKTYTYTYTFDSALTEIKSDSEDYANAKADLLKKYQDGTYGTEGTDISNLKLYQRTWSVVVTSNEDTTDLTKTDFTGKGQQGESHNNPGTATNNITVTHNGTNYTGVALDSFKWSDVTEGDTIKFTAEDTTYTVDENATTNADGSVTIKMTAASNTSSQTLTKANIAALVGKNDADLTAVTENGVTYYTYEVTNDDGTKDTIRVDITNKIGTDTSTSKIELTITNQPTSGSGTATVTDTVVDKDTISSTDADITEALSKVTATYDGKGNVTYTTNNTAWKVTASEQQGFEGSIGTITRTTSKGDVINGKTVTSSGEIKYTFTYSNVAGNGEIASYTDIVTAVGGVNNVVKLLNASQPEGQKYYTDGTDLYDYQGHKLSADTALSNLHKKGVYITVKKEDTSYYADSDTENKTDGNTEAAQTAKAKEEAAKKAYENAKTNITGATEVEGTYKYDETTGKLTVDVTDSDGKTHHLVITSTADAVQNKETTTAWTSVTIDGKFLSGTQHSITANANVTTETVAWVETGKKYEVTKQSLGDSGATVSIDSTGNVTVYDSDGKEVTAVDGVYTVTAGGKTYKYTFGSTDDVTATSDPTTYKSVLDSITKDLTGEQKSVVDGSLSLKKLTYTVTTVSSAGTEGTKGQEITKDSGQLDTTNTNPSTDSITITHKGSTSTTESGKTVTTEDSVETITGAGLDTYDWANNVKAGDTIQFTADGKVYTVDANGVSTDKDGNVTIKMTATTPDVNSNVTLTKGNIATILGKDESKLTAVYAEDGTTVTGYTYKDGDDTISVNIPTGTDTATSTIELTITKQADAGKGSGALTDKTVDTGDINKNDDLVTEAIGKLTDKTYNWSTTTYGDDTEFAGSVYTITRETAVTETTEYGTVKTAGTIIYTFTYTKTDTTLGSLTYSQLVQLVGKQGVVDMLNADESKTTTYKLDGDAIYDADGHELDFAASQNAVSKLNVKVTVEKKDTSEYQNTDEHTVGGNTAQSDAQTIAREAAAKKALFNAASGMKVKNAAGTYEDVSSSNAEYVKDASDNWTLTVYDSNGAKHLLTATIGTDGQTTTGTWKGTGQGTLDGTFSSGTEHTEHGNATVTSDVVSWTNSSESKSYIDTATGGTITVNADGTVTWTETGKDAVTITAGNDGNYTWTYTDPTNTNKTYYYTLSTTAPKISELTPTEAQSLKDNLTNKNYFDDFANSDATVTRVSWSSYTITLGEQDVATDAYKDATGTYTDKTGDNAEDIKTSTSDYTGKWGSIATGTEVTFGSGKDAVKYTVDSNNDTSTEADKANGDTVHTITLTNKTDLDVSSDAGLTEDEIKSKLGLQGTEASSFAAKSDGTGYTYTNTNGDTVTVTLENNGGTIKATRTIVVTATDTTTSTSGKVTDKKVTIDKSDSLKEDGSAADNTVIENAMQLVTTENGKYVLTEDATEAGWSISYKSEDKSDTSGYSDSIWKLTNNTTNVTYTFTYNAGDTGNVNKAAAISDKELAELLGSDYTYHETTGGNAAYITDKSGNVITREDAISTVYEQSVKVQVVKTDTTTSANSTEHNQGNVTQITNDAEDAAAKKALLNAVKSVDNSVTALETSSDKLYENANGSWTYIYTNNGHTYTFTTSVPTSTDNKDTQSWDKTNNSNITESTDVYNSREITVTGTAYVASKKDDTSGAGDSVSSTTTITAYEGKTFTISSDSTSGTISIDGTEYKTGDTYVVEDTANHVKYTYTFTSVADLTASDVTATPSMSGYTASVDVSSVSGRKISWTVKKETTTNYGTTEIGTAGSNIKEMGGTSSVSLTDAKKVTTVNGTTTYTDITAWSDLSTGDTVQIGTDTAARTYTVSKGEGKVDTTQTGVTKTTYSITLNSTPDTNTADSVTVAQDKLDAATVKKMLGLGDSVTGVWDGNAGTYTITYHNDATDASKVTGTTVYTIANWSSTSNATSSITFDVTDTVTSGSQSVSSETTVEFDSTKVNSSTDLKAALALVNEANKKGKATEVEGRTVYAEVEQDDGTIITYKQDGDYAGSIATVKSGNLTYTFEYSKGEAGNADLSTVAEQLNTAAGATSENPTYKAEGGKLYVKDGNVWREMTTSDNITATPINVTVTVEDTQGAHADNYEDYKGSTEDGAKTTAQNNARAAALQAAVRSEINANATVIATTTSGVTTYTVSIPSSEQGGTPTTYTFTQGTDDKANVWTLDYNSKKYAFTVSSVTDATQKTNGTTAWTDDHTDVTWSEGQDVTYQSTGTVSGVAISGTNNASSTDTVKQSAEAAFIKDGKVEAPTAPADESYTVSSEDTDNDGKIDKITLTYTNGKVEEYEYTYNTYVQLGDNSGTKTADQEALLSLAGITEADGTTYDYTGLSQISWTKTTTYATVNVLDESGNPVKNNDDTVQTKTTSVDAAKTQNDSDASDNKTAVETTIKAIGNDIKTISSYSSSGIQYLGGEDGKTVVIISTDEVKKAVSDLETYQTKIKELQSKLSAGAAGTDGVLSTQEIADYNQAVKDYNSYVSKYKELHDEYAEYLEAQNEYLLTSASTDLTDTININGWHTDTVFGEGQLAKLSETQDNVHIDGIVDRLKAAKLDPSNYELNGQKVTSWTADSTTTWGSTTTITKGTAHLVYDALTDDVNTKYTALKNAKAELDKLNTTDEGYDEALEAYRNAGRAYNTSVDAYNTFVKAVNTKATAKANDKTLTDETNTIIQQLNVQTGTTATSGSSSGAYIQMGGTVQIEGSGIEYKNSSYSRADTSPTFYINNVDTDGTDNRWGQHTDTTKASVYVKGTAGIITANESTYNQQVFDLSKLTGYYVETKATEGSATEVTDSTTLQSLIDSGTITKVDFKSTSIQGKLNEIFAPVSKTVPGNKAGTGSTEADITALKAYLATMNSDNQLASGIQISNDEYKLLCDKADAKEIAVLWYVVKTEGDNTYHLDGVLYYTKTGALYSNTDLNAITTKWSDDSLGDYEGVEAVSNVVSVTNTEEPGKIADGSYDYTETKTYDGGKTGTGEGTHSHYKDYKKTTSDGETTNGVDTFYSGTVKYTYEEKGTKDTGTKNTIYTAGSSSGTITKVDTVNEDSKGDQKIGTYTVNYTKTDNYTNSNTIGSGSETDTYYQYHTTDRVAPQTAYTNGTVYTGNANYSYQNYDNTVTAKLSTDYYRTLNSDLKIKTSTKHEDEGNGSGVAGNYGVKYKRTDTKNVSGSGEGKWYTYYTKSPKANNSKDTTAHIYTGTLNYTYNDPAIEAKETTNHVLTLNDLITKTRTHVDDDNSSSPFGTYSVNYSKEGAKNGSGTDTQYWYTYRTQSQKTSTPGTANGTVYTGTLGYKYNVPSISASETTTHKLSFTDGTITQTRIHNETGASDRFGTYDVNFKHVNEKGGDTGHTVNDKWAGSGTGNWYTYYTQSANKNGESGTSNLGSIYTGELDYSYYIPTFSATEQTTHKREFDANTEIVKTTVHEDENHGSGIRGTYDVNYKHTNTDTGTDENGDKINPEWTGKGTGDWYKYKTKRQNDDAERSTTGYVYVGGVKYTYKVPDNKLEAKWEKVYTRNLDADVTSSIDYKVWEYTETTKKVTTLYPSDDEHDNGGDIVPVVPVIVPTTPVVPGETITPVEPGIVPIGTEVTTPAGAAETTPAASKLPQTGASWLEALCMAMLGFALSLGSIFSKGKHEKE